MESVLALFLLGTTATTTGLQVTWRLHSGEHRKPLSPIPPCVPKHLPTLLLQGTHNGRRCNAILTLGSKFYPDGGLRCLLDHGHEPPHRDAIGRTWNDA